MDPRARLADARLYLCTDARRERGDLLDFVAAAIAGGVDVVQLRDKGSAGAREFGTLEAAEELAILGQLRELTTGTGALLAVNDRADLAALSGADILHVGQGDLTPPQARSIVGRDVLIGRSTHDDAQREAALADDDVDYFAVGPCWATPTKLGRSAVGLDLVRAAATSLGANEGTAKPWFAIGGIDERRIPETVAAGASRIVVVRALTQADDPRSAAATLRQLTTAAT